ncbi:universal stress protein [Pollutibacter soli]|uniref:universal stress protein n=1 Tax=Pollutibacter soli TaxID=3034157 RepID=UPI003013F781
MKEMMRILVPIDFSEGSLNALKTATCIAKIQKAAITVLHVRDNMLSFAGIPMLSSNNIEKNAASILVAIESEVEQATGLPPEILESDGIPIREILKTAVEKRISLIVMGTHGASGSRQGYLGSTAAGVIKYAPAPVLLIPEEKTVTSFSNILYLVRMIPTAVRHYPVLRQVFKEGNIELLNLRLPGDRDDPAALEALETEIKRQEPKNSPIKVSSSTTPFVLPQIMAYAGKKKTDLILISPFIDVSSKQFYTGPNLHYLINHCHVPMLIINKVHLNNFVEAAELARENN